MRTYLDCIPCFVRHCLEAVRMTTDDEQVRERILREGLRLASEVDYHQSPPATAQTMHRFIRETTGAADPYLDVKDRFNKAAMEMYPGFKEMIQSSAEPLETAVRLAIAGNIIDSGVNNEIGQDRVEQSVAESLSRPLDMQALEQFKEATDKAEDILYLGDNAGEIVFDRLLIEQLPCEKITFVVKGGPILNDALMADAEFVGLTGVVDVIDNGSDAPGTILADCSEEFRRRFKRADLVIAKGQGNFETLSEVDKDMFFLLQPKCVVLAEHLDREIGSLVLLRKAKSGHLEKEIA